MALLAQHAPAVVVTLGERGLIWQRGAATGALPAFAVDVVDTTGAGDTFHGALPAVGVAQGMAWEAMLRFASAALCCTQAWCGALASPRWRRCRRCCVQVEIAVGCAIMAAFKELTMTVTETIALCKERFPLGIMAHNFKGLLLYGSTARGQTTPESDIDLLVLLDRPFDYFAELRRIVDWPLSDPVGVGSLYSSKTSFCR